MIFVQCTVYNARWRNTANHFLFIINIFYLYCTTATTSKSFIRYDFRMKPVVIRKPVSAGIANEYSLHVSCLSQLLSYGTHFCWDWLPIVSSSKSSILHQVSRISKWLSFETHFCWDCQQYFHQVGRIYLSCCHMKPVPAGIVNRYLHQISLISK